jgi:fructokinase
MIDITAVGEILIDLTQNGINDNGIPVYNANPGGAPANVAVAGAKLGAKTAFIGKIGDDSYGEFLCKTLKENNVDTKGLIVDKKSNTTLAIVSVNENGERSFSFYRKNCADTLLAENEITDEQLKNTHILHFGSVSLTDEPARTAIISAAKRGKAFGATISYDPNYRANLWNNPQEAIEQMKKPLDMVDILKISDEELPLVSSSESLEDGTKYLYEKYNIPLILVTLGENGAYYRFKDITGQVDGFKVKVADTNGAGDTFFGAFLSQMVYKNKFHPSELSKDEIEEILIFANRAASITTSRSGAIPAMPTLDEVEVI